MSDDVVSVGLNADSTSFVRAFNEASTAVQNTTKAAGSMVKAYNWAKGQISSIVGSIISDIKKIAVASVLSLGSIGVQSYRAIKSFQSLQDAVANVATVSSGGASSMGAITETVLKMSRTIPMSAEDIANGLYEVQSAGFAGAEGIEVLGATAKFSIAGVVDMATSVRATASILNAYNMSASQAEHVTDILFKAVEEGQMTAGEFAMNIGDWVSSTAALGVSFESASAALAIMTQNGFMATAASTSLNGMMRALIKPSDTMAKTLRRLGFESGKAMLESEGLAGTLGQLWEAAGKNETTFGELFQDTEGFRGALSLVTNGYDELVDAQDRFNDSSETAGTANEAFNIKMRTLTSQIQLFKNEMRLMTMQMADIAVPVFRGFLEIVTGILRGINSLPEPMRNLVAIFQLFGPALMIIGATWAGFAIKARIFSAAMYGVAGALNKMKIGIVANEFTKLGDAGGVFKYLTNNIRAFAEATNAAKLAMLRMGAQVLITTAALGVMTYALYRTLTTFDDAKKKADAFFDTIGDPKSLQSITDIEQKIIDVQEAGAKGKPKTGMFDWDILGAGIQKVGRSIGAMDETIMRDAQIWADSSAEVEAYKTNISAVHNITNGLTGETEALAQALSLIDARDAGGYTDPRADALQKELDTAKVEMLNRAVADGVLNWDEYLAKYTEWKEMFNNPDLIDWEKSFETGKNEFLDADVGARYNELQQYLDSVNVKLEEYAAQQEKIDIANEASSASSQRFELALAALGEAAATASDKVDAYRAVLDELLGSGPDLRDAQAGMYEALERVGRAMIDNGANFDLATEDGRNLQAALSSASSAARNLMETTYDQTGSMSQANMVVANYVNGLIAMAQNANWSNEQILMMIQSMGLNPETIQTLITLPGMDASLAQLFAAQGLLNGLDGFIAHAGVNIAVTMTMGQWNQTYGPGSTNMNTNGPAPLNAIDPALAAVKDYVKGLMGNIPSGGKKGGGGGGGGAAKWKPTAQQQANMKKALAQPLVNLLTGDLGKTWTDMMLKQWYDVATRNIFMEGKTRLGAGILQQAMKDGKDPTEEFASMVEEYNRLVKLVGKTNADLAINQFESLDQFTDYVDQMEALIEHQRDIEDWKFSRSEINFDEYKAILQKRLELYEEYSDEWMDIMDQIQDVEEDALSEQDRLMSARLELEDIDREAYLNYLYQRLNALEIYSEEYMEIWREIQSVEEDATQELDDKADAVKDFADAVKDAFDDIKKSVEDPILQATSLVAAFGDQATLSRDQLEGFYQHQMEGVARWVDVIKELKARGINQSFLNELIAAGPQSLGFAESVLAMGTEGISFINQSMSDIADMAGGLGTDIAMGQVGTVNQIDNSVTIHVGDIDITGEMPDGVTLAEVQQAIHDALAGVATGVQNGQPTVIGSGPGSGPTYTAQPIGNTAHHDTGAFT